MVSDGVNGEAFPLATGMQAIQDVVEHLEKRDFTFIAAFGGVEMRINVFIELRFR